MSSILKAKPLLKLLMRSGTVPFLWGPPGVGKSDLVRQMAKEDGDIPVIDFRAILRDPVDLRGIPAADLEHNVARWLPPGDLPRAEVHGPRGIFFMDELNAAPPAVQAACFGLVLDRFVGEYRMPDGWQIIAAGNRQSDRAAAQNMPTPLANRMAHVDIDAEIDSFVTWAFDTDGCNPELLAFLRFRKEHLHMMPPKNADEKARRAWPSPRTWAKYSKTYDIIKHDKMPKFVIGESASAVVGEGSSSELVGFLDCYTELPSFKEIMTDPGNAKLPANLSAKYAVTMMLASKIEPKQLDASLIYMDRVGKDMQTSFIFDVLARDNKGFSETAAFVQWVKVNHHTLVNNSW